MKKLLFLILAIICCIAADCGKDKDKPTYYMPQDFKDYVMYPVGSYWVYEDSSSIDRDSVYLFHQQIKIIEGGNTLNYNYEGIYQQFNNSYYNDTLVGGGGINYNNKNSYEYLINSLLMFFSNETVGYINTDVQGLKYEYYYDSLFINNIWYKEVKVFKNLGTYYYDSPKQIYFSRYIGIIKKEMFDGKIWQLKSYQIN